MTEEQWALVVTQTKLSMALQQLRDVLNTMSKAQEESLAPIDLVTKHIQPLEDVSRQWWRLGMEQMTEGS